MATGSLNLAVEHIDHLVLRVRDLATALEFYQDKLGFQVERRLDDLGLVQLRAGNSLIDLVPVDSLLGQEGGGPPATDGPNMAHFCLTLADYDGTKIRAYCEHHNIPISPEEERYGAAGMSASVYLTDPDQNILELKCAKGHSLL